jgi:hypothetical protein
MLWCLPQFGVGQVSQLRVVQCPVLPVLAKHRMQRERHGRLGCERCARPYRALRRFQRYAGLCRCLDERTEGRGQNDRHSVFLSMPTVAVVAGKACLTTSGKFRWTRCRSGGVRIPGIAVCSDRRCRLLTRLEEQRRRQGSGTRIDWEVIVVRALVCAVAAVLAAVGGPVATADPVTAAGSCNARSSGTVLGGFRVTLFCTGAGFIDGYGFTLTDANQQALLLYGFFVESGRNCSGRSNATEIGGQRLTIHCTAPNRFIDGLGSNLTDASVEARELAKLRVTVGRDCGSRSAGLVSGGFRVTVHCTAPNRFIDGLGSTLTGAAQNARLAASIG